MTTNLDLTAQFRATALSNYEVFMIGEALVNWLATTHQLGHASPVSVLDYATNDAPLGLGGLIMRDFIAWTSGRTSSVPGCEDRMRELIENAELGVDSAQRIGAVMRAAIS